MNRSLSNNKSPLAGKRVKLINALNDVGSGAKYPAGTEYLVEDYMANLPGNGGFAMLNYLRRRGRPNPGILYGKIAGLGYCIHESEVTE